MSSPHQGRPSAPRSQGRADAGGGWLRVQPGQPGVLLLRRLDPGGPREWRSPCPGSHWLGHAHLPNRGRGVTRILVRRPAYLLVVQPTPRSPICSSKTCQAADGLGLRQRQQQRRNRNRQPAQHQDRPRTGSLVPVTGYGGTVGIGLRRIAGQGAGAFMIFELVAPKRNALVSTELE